MLLAFSALLAVVVIVALWCLLFPLVGIKNPKVGSIDLFAFQNLLRPDDDLFLQKNLSKADYRRAKRLRTRAAQEYLLWIVHNCSEVHKRLSSGVYENSEAAQAKTQSRLATDIRFLSLKLWLALWLQWLFPGLNIQPTSILDAYKNFTVAVSSVQ